MRSTLLALALLATGCADSPDPVEDTVDAVGPAASGPQVAVAEIAEVDGSGVSGTVRFTSLDDAVEIRYDLVGLSPGLHGFHVHANGDCSADSTGTPAGAAGGHFNPLSSPHGGPDSTRTKRHAGDRGNIEVGPDGTTRGVSVDSLLAFDGPTSVIGKALIVHGGQDDLSSQPSGDAGPRVGCGVIGEPREAAAEVYE